MKNQFTLRCAAVAALTVLASFGAQASEENHFAGGYAVVTQEWKKASATVDGEKLKKSEAAPSIGVGYNFALDAHKTLGIKATLDTKSGEYGTGADSEVKEKSHYSLAFEPGYAVNDKVLVFGILAYHKAKAEYVVAETAVGSASLTGFGYGIGAKYALANHLFLMGEVQKIGYSSKTIDSVVIKPASTVIAVGLGYHF
jgi:opacity protein-like surface antigen